jgi:hypothetical protein
VAEQRAQEIGQCGEGELRLGLGTAGPDDRDGPASAFGQRFEQCRLADPGLAPCTIRAPPSPQISAASRSSSVRSSATRLTIIPYPRDESGQWPFGKSQG